MGKKYRSGKYIRDFKQQCRQLKQLNHWSGPGYNEILMNKSVGYQFPDSQLGKHGNCFGFILYRPDLHLVLQVFFYLADRDLLAVKDTGSQRGFCSGPGKNLMKMGNIPGSA